VKNSTFAEKIKQTMYSFKNDYSEGAHPAILKALLETNLSQQEGYCEDEYALETAKMLRTYLESSDADIHFISGGTQANLVVISSILRPHESVIAPITGHIYVHETGAIEATGHRISTIDTNDGKLTPGDVEKVLLAHTDEHMVKPKMVFISNTTEVGTIYTRNELIALKEYCSANDLFLYLDGARLGSALCAKNNDVTLPDLAKYTDAFYIGGTKNGALLGEAIVINNDLLKKEFRFFLKQRGALLAKGRIMALQFRELFKNDIYFENARHANSMAQKMSKAIAESGFSFLTQSTTNQIFPILPNTLIEELNKNLGFYIWSKTDDHNSVIRLVTSWATPEGEVDKFIDILRKDI